MKQGDFFRLLAGLTVASAGAAIALAVAAVTGNLGTTTTVNDIVTMPVASTTSGAATRSHSSLTVARIYQLDAPGVVEVGASAGSASSSGGTAIRPLGSGFVIDKAGHILTSSNVIAGVRGIEVGFSGDEAMRARVVGVDAASGVAVLQIDAHSRALSPLPIGDSDLVEVGDPVVAIGNPFDSTRTATAGIVSAVQKPVDVDPLDDPLTTGREIETDAAINAGSSGGPLINALGQVIGVNAKAPADTAAGSIGLGFAIPIDTVMAVAAQLIHHGKVEIAYLGLSAVPLTGAVARTFGLPSTTGLLIQDVNTGSAASKAGLRAGSTAVVLAGQAYRIGGDIIIAADGVPTVTESELRDVIAAHAPGERIQLEIWRENRKEIVVVTLGRPPG